MRQILLYILNHPLNRKRKIKAICLFLIWQFKSRVWNKPYIHLFTSRSKLIIKQGMTGATGNLYCGLHEFEDMSFLLHFLRRDDIFLDIGANVGSYTVLATAHCSAKTISVEPVPSTYYWLQKNIELNKITEKVKLLNCGVTKSPEKLLFTKEYDTINHVATAEDELTDKIEVEGLPLDLICENDVPDLMKVDVEGFEMNVIVGGSKTLANSKLKCLIIELNGSGLRYGFDDRLVHNALLEFGFNSFTYSPFERILKPVTMPGGYNTIYIRDVSFVKDRIKLAEKISIRGLEY